MSTHEVHLEVNGTPASTTVEARTLLVQLLRGPLGLTGTHVGCDTTNCGACTVLIDGEPVKSCTVLAVQAEGSSVTTVEGLADGEELAPVQEGFRQCHGLQCGFCTPGVLTTAAALLEQTPDPDEAQIRDYLDGCMCRCTGYQMIVDSVRWAAEHPAGAEVTP